MTKHVGVFLSILWFFVGCGSVNPNSPREFKSYRQVDGVSEPYHSPGGWEKPIRFHLSDEFPSQLVHPTLNAIDTWNDAIGYEALVFEGMVQVDSPDSLYDSLDDDYTVLYWQKRWSETLGKDPSTHATTIWTNYLERPDVIERADILLNAETYDFCNFDDGIRRTGQMGKTRIDSESVLLHEFGHVLGLGHILTEDDPGSVMNPHYKKTRRRILSPSDLDNVRTIYGH